MKASVVNVLLLFYAKFSNPDAELEELKGGVGDGLDVQPSAGLAAQSLVPGPRPLGLVCEHGDYGWGGTGAEEESIHHIRAAAAQALNSPVCFGGF